MKKLLVACLAAVALLVLAVPASAGNSAVFTSSSPSAAQVRAAFTVERNHFYALEMFDASGTRVCRSTIDVTANRLEDGSEFSLVCFADAAGAHSATLTVERQTHLTPTFTWV